MAKHSDIYISAPVRTPIGKFGGALRSLSAADLGVLVAEESLKRASISNEVVDEVIFGCARQAGVGPNVARQIAYRVCSESMPAYTVNMACASGLKAIINAYQTIRLRDAEFIIAGGTESMSNIPYLLTKGRWGYRLGNERLVDAMYEDGYLCPLCDQLMGETAENLAEKYTISREESDAYALKSQTRTAAAQENRRYAYEIAPVTVSSKKGETVFERDEHPRPTTNLEALAKLQPVFKDNGTVHAGNASGITDGAAAMIVSSESKSNALGIQPFARIVDYSVAGVAPSLMGVGPVPAIKNLLKRNHLNLSDIDLIELNEAFAVQVLACHKELDFDMDRLNVNGGAIALGHPTGCSGTRIVVTLLHEMKRRKAKLGIAALCVSGGMGVALLVENVLN